MGINERREREKERLRTRILEAASDIVSEEGLKALSMRALAERIEYSPATIYLYFRDKEALLRELVAEGFRRLGESMQREIAEVGEDASPLEQYRALGYAYVRFALENTAFFRAMFRLPSVARMECPEEIVEAVPMTGEAPWHLAVRSLEAAMEAGLIQLPDTFRGALIGWGLLHGLISLYIGGHLSEEVETPEEFMAVVDEAMDTLRAGWRRPAGETVDRDRP